MTVPLVGYLDRLSARPSEAIAVKVSSQLGVPYTADLVRIIHADPNPDGPGVKLEERASDFAGLYPSRAQGVDQGSYAVVDADLAVPDGGGIVVLVQPGLLDAPQPVLALGEAVLLVSAEGAMLRTGAGVVSVAAPMLERCWYELKADFHDGQVTLSQSALQRSWGVTDSGVATGPAVLPAGPRLLIAADFSGGRFDGRIEDPALRDAAGETIAAWDFTVGIDTDVIHGTHPGRLVNLPTRGIRGARWDGTELDWKHAPSHYAAIHFHADDLYDCCWQTDFTVTIPADLRSGVYGVRLRAGGETEILPFFVLPPRGTTTARIAYLAATFTYQAYANHARFNLDDAFRARISAWGATPHNPQDHGEYGCSTYNRHPDGTGISLSSLRRPILNLRPFFLTFNDQKGSGLRHFSADSHLTDWLEAKGVDFDVITDHDLHREGVDLLRGYACVLTGSHPEYHTPQTLDALGDYIGEGGRLCYLGGNGFYWRIAVSETIADVLEVRRTEGGIRAWDAAPGEAYHQLDGGYGGLWRRLGRAPQKLAGVGFSSQGLFEGSYYRRLPASCDPAVAWIFEGVTDEILGNFGLSGGGAAGFELDRADRRLGSAANLVVLARSEAHQAHFVAVPEELLSHVNTVTGEAPRDLIRAEIVYFETANGGAVFATGSITFCGSLSQNGYDNNISRMLQNIITKFQT